MGGSSKSSSAQSSTTTTNQLSSDGVVAGDLYQATGSLTINDYLSDETVNVFTKLIDLTSDALSGAKTFAESSIQTIAANEEREENPELANLTKIMPAILLGIAAVAAIMIFKK